MMPLPRWKRHALGLWAGLLAAGLAAAVVVYLRYPERFVPAVIVTGVMTVLVGGVLTVRMHSRDQEPLLTVADLRRR